MRWHFLLLVLVCIWAVRRFGWDALFVRRDHVYAAYSRLLLRDDIRMLSPGRGTMLNVHAIASNVGLDSLWIPYRWC